MNVSALEDALRREVDGEVRFDAGSRGAYATDASNYRQVPIGVVVPRSVDAAAVAVRVCREHDAPVLSRGGGTSLAGQCTNTAVVIDWTKYCDRLVSVNPDARSPTPSSSPTVSAAGPRSSRPAPVTGHCTSPNCSRSTNPPRTTPPHPARRPPARLDDWSPR